MLKIKQYNSTIVILFKVVLLHWTRFGVKFMKVVIIRLIGVYPNELLYLYKFFGLVGG